MTLTEFVLVAVAAHRLWILYMTQPVFAWARRLAAKVHPKLGDDAQMCGLCVSVWTAALCVALWAVPYGTWPLWFLAISNGIGMVDVVLGAVERVGRPQMPYMLTNGTPAEHAAADG